MQDTGVEYLGLSTRTLNCLKRSKIFFLSQLMELTEKDMLSIRNMGQKSIKEILNVQKKFATSGEKRVKEKRKCSDIEINCLELMIHKAFPQLIGRKITSLEFKDKDGLYFSELDVKTLGFSVRTQKVLLRNGISKISELALLEYSYVRKFNNLGVKSINEIIEYLRYNTKYALDGQTANDLVEEVYSLMMDTLLSDISSEEDAFFSKQLKITIASNSESFQICSSNEFVEKNKEAIAKVFKADALDNCAQQYIVSIIHDSRKSLSLSILKERISHIWIDYGVFNRGLHGLLAKQKIEIFQGTYREYFPYIKDWIASLQGNEKIAVNLRIEGNTLEESGQKMGLTRERVRQIVAKAIRKKPRLREDDYNYWFCTYDIGRDAFIEIFSCAVSVFNYLNLVYKHGTIDVEEMLSDINLNSFIYSNLQTYLNRDSILIGDNHVPCKRELLCRELAKVKCSEQEMSFEDFYIDYLNLLKDNHVDDDKKLLFPTERAFEARLQDSTYILMKYGRRFRYYPINEYDINELIRELHLEQFQNVEISTLKLFNEYPEIMQEFDIQDEYELHNLLKKTSGIWNPKRYDLVLTRMPLMAFGNINREQQTKDLLFQIAPVTIEEFAEYYEMEYGVLARTVMANMSPLIANYYHNGVYKIDQTLFTDSEYDFMKHFLTDDFYFTEDVKKIFETKFGESNISHVNPRTLKELGFRIYTNYIIKNKYSSADEYFTKLLKDNTTIDLTAWDPRLGYIQQANQSLDSLRSSYELIEYEDKKYIRYDHFVGVAKHLDKVAFKRYVDDAIQFSEGREFFSISSLRRHGFENEIHNLGFSDWFPAGLLKNSKKIKYIKVGRGILFYKGTAQKTTVDFLRYIMRDVRKMDIEDFVDFLSEEYGVKISREKVSWLVKDSGMYYDSIMEKIYYTKEEYYEEF